MKNLNRTNFVKPTYPERIIQFGEGNFLRAFADWIIHKMNKTAGFNSGVVVVQPIEHGMTDVLNQQDGLYTLYLNGIKNGEKIREHEIIDCVQRAINPYTEYDAYLECAAYPELKFVVSNTTEAGITHEPSDSLQDRPQKSFPGKLTALLYKRFEVFGGDKNKGLIIMPCELIDKNGDQLKKIVLKYVEDWNLSATFNTWLEESCIFCNTLVDRIVPGYPKNKITEIENELGYTDNLVVEGEQFHLWVIEGPKMVAEEFPTEECGLNIVFTDNLERYRTRKVRILNGAHTTMVPVGLLYGLGNVLDVMQDDTVGSFIKKAIYEEIGPTLTNFSEEELHPYVEDTLSRFKNPYMDHRLESISLNSISKFKTRVLPSILKYNELKGKPPKRLLFALASLIVFYRGEYNGISFNLKDDPKILAFFENVWSQNLDLRTIAHIILSKVDFWGKDLTEIHGLEEIVHTYLTSIVDLGITTKLRNLND